MVAVKKNKFGIFLTIAKIEINKPAITNGQPIKIPKYAPKLLLILINILSIGQASYPQDMLPDSHYL